MVDIVVLWCRLPLPSVGDRRELARAARRDSRIVPVLHVKGDDIILLTFSFLETRDGCEVALWAEPMSPTI